MKAIHTLRHLILLSICALALLPATMYGQKISDLPEKERNEKLIKIARTIFKNQKFKESYREYGTPTIRTYNIDTTQVNKDPESIGYGKDLGSLIYIVTFPYDKSKEKMEWYDFAAEVYISDKQSKAYTIILGNGYGYDIYDLNQ